MDYLIPLLVILFILLVGVALVGHGSWLMLAWSAREILGGPPQAPVQTLTLDVPAPQQCLNCHVVQLTPTKHCPFCSAARPTPAQEELWRELEATLHQLDR